MEEGPPSSKVPSPRKKRNLLSWRRFLSPLLLGEGGGAKRIAVLKKMGFFLVWKYAMIARIMDYVQKKCEFHMSFTEYISRQDPCSMMFTCFVPGTQFSFSLVLTNRVASYSTSGGKKEQT